MAEAFNTRDLAAVLNDDDLPKKTISALPKELLVSIFIAVEDQIWIRHTVPLVCKNWAQLYRSQDASPLHAELVVDFVREAESAVATEGGPNRGCLGPAARAAAQKGVLRRPFVHASRVISWAQRGTRLGSVHRLHLKEGCSVSREPFTAEDLSSLVSVVAPTLTELWIGCGLYKQYGPLWEALKNSVAPRGKLRSLVIKRIYAEEGEVEAGLEPSSLQQLAGPLEELVLDTYFDDPEAFEGVDVGLSHFSQSFCERREAPGAEFTLRRCRLSAFPAELGNMKSLRDLNLTSCGLRAVPAFVGELKALEFLDLSWNDEQICATLDSLVKGCPRLREVRVYNRNLQPESLAHLEAFEEKLLLAGNSSAKVIYERQ